MANQEHLSILRKGVDDWNKWRGTYMDIIPRLKEAKLSQMNLRGADLRRADLSQAYLSEVNLSETYLNEANLRGADLRLATLNTSILSKANLQETDLRGARLNKANLSEADLRRARLNKADLRGANLNGADLGEANLSEANLSRATLIKANLHRTNLSKANLSGADLRRAVFGGADLNGADLGDANLRRAFLTGAMLLGTNIEGTDLSGSHIYGISAWDIQGTPQQQNDLSITPWGVAEITVDDLETAQFIYLILNNEKIRNVIDTITSRAVLILGRFTEDRKAVLDALRDELRNRGLAPILFDFEKPASRNLTETVSTLAHMARFVIADITDAKSIPQELQRIIPDLPGLPVQPIILESQYEYAMFRDFMDYPWVLQVHRYASAETLLAELEQAVIAPATEKAEEIAERRKLFEQQLAESMGS